ncbi:biotin--[acetyl-CoA-carboxylase] ligase [Lacibacter sp. H375]|uniref:biotin--[acetyl-CoA-carboxylase] ligase n=1 Tax=Lacibacter sp. H375 TaxID=3133424 RepID=UPI0030C1A32D
MLPKKSDNLWIELPSVDSTNNYAMGLIHEGLAQHGLTVRTAHQTKGKGQRGKVWETEPGANLSFSIIVKPGLLLTQSFQLLAATALAVRDELEKVLGDETKIKWPNDLYWRDRKTGGILIENVVRGSQWQWAVIGIGINVNQTEFKGLKNPVSIKQVTGKDFDVLQLAHCIQKAVLKECDHLQQQGFAGIFETYNRQLYKLQQPVRLKKESRILSTNVKGVNSTGQLITGIDVEECFDFGEVEWLL